MESPPHSYTTDGRVVVERYRGSDAEAQAARKATVLRALGGGLPVPQLVDAAGGKLRTRFVPGGERAAIRSRLLRATEAWQE